MHASFATILTLLPLALTGVLSLPTSSHEPEDHPHPTQPGCGTAGCHNPTGTFGLVRDNLAYHHLCDQHSPSAKHDHRPKVCFDTQVKLEKFLSAPNPEQLHGYIDGSDTNFVLFAGQMITLGEAYQIHVTEAEGEKAKRHGCARVTIHTDKEWKLQLDEVWCAGHNQPIQL